ncbi:MAG: immunoglobulin domain-containing protein [Phycisphaerales bacterium]
MKTLIATVAALAVCGQTLAQPDRILDTPAGWGYLYGATGNQINTSISTGSRPFSIELATTGLTPTYDTLFVVNSGAYAVSGSMVTYGQTSAGITTWLNTNNLRLLDLEGYENAAGNMVFTAVGVPNSGATAAPGWGWVAGVSVAQINSWLSGTNLRLIDLDTYTIGTTKYYSAVAVPNTGANVQSWWVYYNITEAQVVAELTANSARLISIAIESGGTITSAPRYSVVMVGQNPGAGWFHGNLSSAQVNDLVNQYGARLTCMRRFTNFVGSTRFAVAMVDNSNAQTRRVRDLLWAGTDGITGFTLKQVGGPVLAGVNQTFAFEPCSTVKLLHGVYAIHQCSIGADSLNANVEHRNECSSCPFTWTCTPVFHSVSDTVRALLEPSSNNALIALEKRYSIPSLLAFADAHGAPSLTLDRQDCQCAVVLNKATTGEMADFMEQAVDGTLYSNSWREQLFDRMNDLDSLGYGSYMTLNNVINQEAAAINLPTTVRDQFKDAVRYVNKGGSYECGNLAWGTEGGWASLPRKVTLASNWLILPREYTFALFGHNASTLPTIVYSMKQEMLREQIAEALATWKTACEPEVQANPLPVSVAPGATVLFGCTATSSGGIVTYQWRRNGVNLTVVPGHISGVFGTALTISNVTSADEGTYTCMTTTACGTDLSSGAVLSVSCYPDCNNSNTLTVADFGCFQGKYALGDLYADCNASGNLTVADFGCFQGKYILGCP